MTTTIHDQVREFHQAAGQATRTTPTIPDERVIRRRLRLVTEESLELVAACITNDEVWVKRFHAIHETLRDLIDAAPLDINMPGVADACGDIDYVVEGTRQEFGINGAPIAAEIHRANMGKFGPGSHKREDGKVLKPPGWKPPDIEGELRKQGWAG